MKTNRMRTLSVLLTLSVLAATGLATTGKAAAAPLPSGRYIVTSTSTPAVSKQVKQLRSSGGSVTARYSRVLHGFAGEFTAAQLRELRADPSVKSITPDQRISVSDTTVTSKRTQTGATWGLDRIDQRATASDGKYHYTTSGKGVTAFVIDSGIRLTHSQFGGRAVSGYDFVDYDTNASECSNGTGHGTHVAGTIGGRTYGVAKNVRLVSLRVFDCNGDGYSSDFISALEWAVDHKPSGPSVVNFSGGGEADSAADTAVSNTIKAGISVVVAAGNEGQAACNVSPARVPAAVTVGASDVRDREPSFSNYGKCVDLFAPGVNILSAGITSNTATATMSGTSMATPHVVGAVARYLQNHKTATPAQVAAALVKDSTPNAITLVHSGTPNRLLYADSTPVG